MAPKYFPPNSTSVLSRRNFLKLMGFGVAAAGVAALNPKRVWGDFAAGLSPMIHWKPKTFASLSRPVFTVNGGPAHNLAFELVQLMDGTAKIYRAPGELVDALADDCFMLIFRGPSIPVLAQDSYEFEHLQFGRFLLFITPGPATDQGQKYTAVINHVQA